VLYTGEEFSFWVSPDGSPLFPLYWKYDHYLREVESFVTDQASLLDSNHAIIAGHHEFTGKHDLIKCKFVIKNRCISRGDTLGTYYSSSHITLLKHHVAFIISWFFKFISYF
jgi:hypothetical protein